MKIIVCVKTNMDLQMVRIKNREPVLEAIPYKVGDLEKNALEAAIQIKESGAQLAAHLPSGGSDVESGRL